MKLKKKKSGVSCDLSIGRSVWTELKALFHLPPNAFHGRGIARMKFSSGKLNVASRWKGPEGKHGRAGRIVTGSKQNPVSRSKKERKNEKGKREREKLTRLYIHIYQAINSENESTLLHRKNYLNALWAACVLRFFKYDQRETRRTRLRVMHMRYVPEIHIYIYT